MPRCDLIGRLLVRPVLPLAGDRVDLDHEDLARTHAHARACWPDYTVADVGKDLTLRLSLSSVVQLLFICVKMTNSLVNTNIVMFKNVAVKRSSLWHCLPGAILPSYMHQLAIYV